MKFLTPGEKLKEIRKILKIKQCELEAIGVSRNFISMVEGNKRKLSSELALKISDIFKEKANTLGIDMDIDYEYLKLSPKKAAERYCNEKLNGSLSIEDIDEIIELSNKYKLFNHLFNSYILKANILFNKAAYGKSCVSYYNALELCVTANNDSERAMLYNNIGKCNFKEMNYIESLEFFTKAYELSIKTNDIITKKKSQFNIALSHIKLANFDEALKNINTILNESNILKDFTYYINAVILQANCYVEKGENKKALDIYTHLINSNNINDITIIEIIYNNMGAIYNNLNNLENSLKYFEKSIEIRSRLNDPTLLHSLIDKASALLTKNMYEQAIQYANDGISLALCYNDLEYLLNGYDILVKAYKRLRRLSHEVKD